MSLAMLASVSLAAVQESGFILGSQPQSAIEVEPGVKPLLQ
jgi:hypothetical protein